MRRADLWLSVRQRKLPCVIDPTLALCHVQGPQLAQQLTQVLEPWLTRSFWQAIDASELLLRHGRTCEPAPPAARVHTQPLAETLLEWMRLRETTDAGSWTFRWIGDCYAESQTQDAADAQVLARYEALAESLLARLPEGDPTPAWQHRYDPVAGAIDTLVLSATLQGAAVLTTLPQAEGSARVRPWPAQALERLGLEPQALDALQPVFAAERALLYEAFAVAGLAPLVELMPPLAVLHVLAGDDGTEPWRCARAWWYRL
jgi:hypothetical protein